MGYLSSGSRVTELKATARDRFAELVPAAEVRDLPGAAHAMHMSMLMACID